MSASNAPGRLVEPLAAARIGQGSTTELDDCNGSYHSSRVGREAAADSASNAPGRLLELLAAARLGQGSTTELDDSNGSYHSARDGRQAAADRVTISAVTAP